MEDLQPRDVARELGTMPQYLYNLLWAGRLKAKQDPQTEFWTISRASLEAFKRRRARNGSLGARAANRIPDQPTE